MRVHVGRTGPRDGDDLRMCVCVVNVGFTRSIQLISTRILLVGMWCNGETVKCLGYSALVLAGPRSGIQQ